MLNSRNPDHLTVDKYLGNFSEHRRALSYSIGQGSRWRLDRSASVPGPGHYRHDRDFPQNDGEVGTMYKTGVRTTPKYSVPEDPRVTKEGVIKGLRNPSSNRLGPGHYEQVRMNVRSAEKALPMLRFPQAIESAEALRERKKKNTVPGPDRYQLKRDFDDSGKEKQKAMERAVRRGTHCWAESQYSHIFTCMKPPKKEVEDGPVSQQKAVPGQQSLVQEKAETT